MEKDVAIRLAVTGADDGKLKLDSFTRAGDKLSRMVITPKINLGDKDALGRVADLGLRLDKLGKAVVTARANVDDKAAQAKLLDLGLRLDKLNKTVANPKISDAGATRAMASILRVDAALDHLNGKTAHVEIKEKADSKGGLFADLFGPVSELSAKASAAGLDAGQSLSDGFGSAKGYLIGAAVYLAAAFAPAMVPTALGAGVAVGGVLIAALTNKKFKKKLTSWWHGLMADLGKDVQPMIAPLEQILGQISGWVRSESKPLREMFSASIPILRMFVKVGEQFATSMIPAITASLKELRPELPELTKALSALLNGFVLFIKELGPGIKPSVSVFLGICRILEGAMAALGATCSEVASQMHESWDALVLQFRIASDTIRTLVTIFHDMLTGHFDQISKDVSHIWSGLLGNVQSSFGGTKSWIDAKAKDFGNDLDTIWHSISADITGIWDRLWNWAGNRFTSLKNGVVNEAVSLWHDTVNAFRSLDRDVTSVFGGTWRTVQRLAQDGAHWVLDAINLLIRAWDDVGHFVGLSHINPLKLASGGRVGGQGNGDIVPAMLTPGEVVVPRHMVTSGMVDHLRGRLPGFAHGGSVGDAGGGPGSNTGKKGALPPGEARGKAGAQQEAGSISFGGIVSDILSLGRKAITAPAVAAIRASESAAKHIGFPIEVRMYDAMANSVIARLDGAVTTKESSTAGGGSQEIPAWFKKTFQHDPYVWGGNSTTHGADCSGATLLTYRHFGLADGMPRTAASQYDWANKISTPVPGALTFLKGSDGSNDRSGAGHVGIAVDGKSYMAEYDTATGFRQGPYDGPHTFGLPKGWTKQRFMSKFAAAGGGGPVPVSMMNIGRWLNAHGLSRAASAGICGCIAGESGGNPESVGSGGGGLIGWTPMSSARPFSNIVTHHPQTDLGHQLVDILQYIRTNGSIRDMNAFRSPVAAADHFSSKYERPAVRLSDVRPSVAKSVYARLANGGWITEPMMGVGLNTGRLTMMGENEAEYVTPASKMGGGSGGDVFAPQITIQCGVGDPRAIGQEIEQVMNRYGRLTGKGKFTWTK